MTEAGRRALLAAEKPFIEHFPTGRSFKSINKSTGALITSHRSAEPVSALNVSNDLSSVERKFPDTSAECASRTQTSRTNTSPPVPSRHLP